MRIVVIIFFIAILTNSFGQTKQDTLKIFESKAKAYLEQTYSHQNIDSAVEKWNKVIYLDLQDIYYKKDDSLSNKLILLDRLKQDYRIFYATHKGFTLLHFDYKNISDESENPTIYFKYSYKEKVKNQDSIGSSYLYFIFDKELLKWGIWDFRISEVLGVPKRWMK